MKWDYKNSKLKPDIIWASPPCTTNSKATHKHRVLVDGKVENKSKEAEDADKLVRRLIKVIDYFKPKFFFIENPVGYLRYFPPMKRFNRFTVKYGAYGHEVVKPTDIFTNLEDFKPREINKNKVFKEFRAIRGGYANRIKIPPLLIRDLLKSTKLRPTS